MAPATAALMARNGRVTAITTVARRLVGQTVGSHVPPSRAPFATGRPRSLSRGVTPRREN